MDKAKLGCGAELVGCFGSCADGRFLVENRDITSSGSLTYVAPDGDLGSTATGREHPAKRPFAVERDSIFVEIVWP